MKPLIALVVVLIAAISLQAQESAELGSRLVAAARKQIGATKEYDPTYVTLAYPGGDVPLKTGVCCDVVVRALRPLGIDLQKEVHEDMQKDFSAYPQKWGLRGPDKNIDHRRVPNLMCYFERNHTSISRKLTAPDSYKAGDIVTWDLGRGVVHIGIVSDKVVEGTPLIIHNIGGGAVEENILFRFKITGHYRLKATGQLANAANAEGAPRPTPSATNRVSASGGLKRQGDAAPR